MKSTPIQQLKQVLSERNYDVLSDYGYQLLKDKKMVVNQDQARVMAQIIKDVSSTVYSAGYAQGKADQAYEYGLRDGKMQQ
ncbi:hypothetical protein [uncultured Lactobacillus sp.]|uniref:hypothetical protein n=1 Tax=uncultured Lactobacillus sp. TaxID=153152 RepID=UPI00258EF793|nr:hypothetical protein [uncultured Lactobacillus sp.]